ncbi:monocarboxylate transporter 6-like isoform X2 [Artemia franciscana]|uniref:monocarboxylate transporter 6-like isoform X2 n=1 Tax=Artemia franciscana TaxID=6661 RepID=UPI0032DA78CD
MVHVRSLNLVVDKKGRLYFKHVTSNLSLNAYCIKITIYLYLYIELRIFNLPRLFYSFSIYYPVIISYYDASRSATSWVGSLFSGVFMMAGPLATIWIRKFGLRSTIMFGGLFACFGYVGSALAENVETLLFTYGIVAGFGCCLNYTAWFIAISRSFVRYKSLALSLSSVGVGIGVFALGPFFNVIIFEYGLSSSFLISAGMALQLCVFGSLVFPVREISSKKVNNLEEEHIVKLLPVKPNEEIKMDACEMCSLTSYHEHEIINIKMTTREAILNPSGLCLHVANFLWMGSTLIIYVMMRDYVNFVQLDEYFLLSFTVIGAGDLIGRLSTGFVIKITGVSSPVLMVIASSLCFVSIISFSTVENGVQLLVQVALFGITYGFQNILVVLVPATIFGEENLDLVLGYTFFFSGLGLLMLTPIAGVIMDYFGTYMAVLIFSSLLQLLSSLFSFGSYFFYNSKKNAFVKTVEGDLF